MRVTRVVLAATCAALVGARAHAVVIAPGGGPPPSTEIHDFDPGSAPLDGVVLASRTTPFEIREFDEEVGQELWVRGQFEHWVVREAQTGYLAFHYRVSGGESNWRVVDAELTTIEGFASYLTEVRAESPEHAISVNRTADGDRLSFYMGQSLGSYFVIRTDAPAFAEGGEFRQMVDFEPTRTDGAAVLATFRPVPEPAGLLTFSAAALLLPRRRAAVVPPRNGVG